MAFMNLEKADKLYSYLAGIVGIRGGRTYGEIVEKL